ncbi:hypothetical protein AWB78_05326 [Caballeronia calidae]|uniref:Uncharacterized protein n=1 Tax=Caballeronia calidae TaxID=1777139 RepID=A0A158DL80_9BURK|nr:hypothetical protein [Caballeronia calidae]SAK95305.1 hypothetical protein AWB78_05326 [Caballeronia calidae]
MDALDINSVWFGIAPDSRAAIIDECSIGKGRTWVHADGSAEALPEVEARQIELDPEVKALRAASLAYTSPECVRKVMRRLGPQQLATAGPTDAERWEQRVRAKAARLAQKAKEEAAQNERAAQRAQRQADIARCKADKNMYRAIQFGPVIATIEGETIRFSSLRAAFHHVGMDGMTRYYSPVLAEKRRFDVEWLGKMYTFETGVEIEEQSA